MHYLLVISIAFFGAAMDIFWHKVLNGSILLFVILGVWYRVSTEGWMGCVWYLWGGAVPLLFLFPLFSFRMLGAGDIKLLSVLGGIMGAVAIVRCIVVSFVLASILSAAVIAICGNLQERLRYFTDYISQAIHTREIRPYYKTGDRMENIHFCVPVLMSVMLYVGGIY